MDESFAHDLADWLEATSDRYVVARTLKHTNTEVTEVVYARDEQGKPTIGPFVRKRFCADAGRGLVYEQLLRAQAQGMRLSHQPLLYECERTGEFFDVVMEYVPGRTLREVAESGGGGIGLAARVMPALCDAVAELHESFPAPLIHRDVKPSNAMLANGQIYLIDLGIARTYRTDAARDTVRYGTPGYAPPEQFGYGQTSTLSDVYALGMTLAFCLLGEDPKPQLRERGFDDPRIPQNLRPVLIRATEFDPKRRHQSARALRADFEHALAANGAGSFRATSGTAGAQATSSAAGTGGISVTQSSPTHPQKTGVKTLLNVVGIIWNVLLAGVWLLMSTACIRAIVYPPPENAQHPPWFIVLEYMGLVFVPWSLGTYLLLDKRRLRKHPPFSKLSWRVEVPFCLIGIVLSMVPIIILYLALFRDA